MTRLLRLLVLLAIVAGACPPAAALDLQRLRMMTAAEQVAWRGVGLLSVRSRLAESKCTATLIAEDLVLTAAHCVVSTFTGLTEAPEAVEFTAGARLGVNFGKSRAKRIAVHPRYHAGEGSAAANTPFDLALIRLQKPIPRARAPFFAIAPMPTTAAPLTLISYRKDRDNGLTRQDGCAITEIGLAEAEATEPATTGAGAAQAGDAGIGGAVLKLACEVIPGASGSALFEEIDGESRIVAVLSAMSTERGKAVAYAASVEAAIAEVLAVLD